MQILSSTTASEGSVIDKWTQSFGPQECTDATDGHRARPTGHIGPSASRGKCRSNTLIEFFPFHPLSTGLQFENMNIYKQTPPPPPSPPPRPRISKIPNRAKKKIEKFKVRENESKSEKEECFIHAEGKFSRFITNRKLILK